MSEKEQAEKCIEIAKKAMENKDWSKVSTNLTLKFLQNLNLG